jgi:anti-sigma regulatory factor (Ser/Thr protein kinase)
VTLNPRHADLSWQWLAPAVQMAADATANWPLTAPPGAPGRAFLPRVAIRTPGTEARSIRAAREFTAATVRRWGATERCDDITVVMSELLTNALRHALPDPATEMPRHPIRLGLLQLSHHLLCAVADPCSKPPVPAQPCGLAENGRGLHVIAALADSWGSTPPSRTGKIVWALFTLDHHGALGATGYRRDAVTGHAYRRARICV